MALYDPKEFPQEITTDFTIADVLAWARTKPADEHYDYTSPKRCAVCQFLRERGIASDPRVKPDTWRDGQFGEVRHPLDCRINTAAIFGGTFGGFAMRLESVLA